MRGTQPIHYPLTANQRIIPAHAGNTQKEIQRPKADQDHPRACGEHSRAYGHRASQTGSSPRMRGTLVIALRPESCMRIIPAHAGNTAAGLTQQQEPGDHPRACGEHYVQKYTIFDNPGSSPRMRGTRYSNQRRTRCNRIIPAHAGNTTGGR